MVICWRRPSWFAVLLTLLGIAFFVRLGVWQLHRASYKEQLLAQFAEANKAPLKPFAKVSDKISSISFAHVQVTGRFLLRHRYLLDDQFVKNQYGVQVLAPFRVLGRSRFLLVDLGFVAHGHKRRNIPRLPTLPTGVIRLRGLYTAPPAAGLELGGNQLAKQTDWPKLTTYLKMGQVERDLGQPLFPGVLLSDPEPSTPYLRIWTPSFVPPARHQAYALQWFTFAMAALVIFLSMHLRRVSPKDGQNE